VGFFIRALPKGFSLFLGARLGDLVYYFDLKRKALVYANIKTAFGKDLSVQQLTNLTRQFFQGFGQNLIEIFFMPLIDKEYINKYISFAGLEFIDQAFKTGTGVILLGVHSGSWELSNIICANLGFPFNLFVRDQRYPRLNELLNTYRRRKGCKIIQRENQVRHLIEALKKNEAIGMTIDQGGKGGSLVKFFGKDASMATGAIRLALKYGSVILPAFSARIKGAYIKTIIEPPFKIKNTGNPEKDMQDNLQEIIHIFEKNIREHTKDYLWTYKIWKYSKDRKILILTDGKTGHLRQAQAVAKIIKVVLGQADKTAEIETIEIKFRNNFAKKAIVYSSCLAGKYRCQACLWCLKTFLQEDIYKSLIGIKPDIIISCGSSVAPINYVLSRENLAKSIVILRPSILSVRRFDLVIMPKHDKPPNRKNIVVTEGALNLIDEDYLKEESSKLTRSFGPKLQISGLSIGLLVGGDTKGFNLEEDSLLEVIQQIKSASAKFGAKVLVTTSRRTPKRLERLVKEEFKDYPNSALLVIANENNIPEAVGGILGLSDIVICSAESISMISEAINSKKYVLVFNVPRLSKKHKRFLQTCAKHKYIYLEQSQDLGKRVEDIMLTKPQIRSFCDNFSISEAVRKIL